MGIACTCAWAWHSNCQCNSLLQQLLQPSPGLLHTAEPLWLPAGGDGTFYGQQSNGEGACSFYDNSAYTVPGAPSSLAHACILLAAPLLPLLPAALPSRAVKLSRLGHIQLPRQLLQCSADEWPDCAGTGVAINAAQFGGSQACGLCVAYQGTGTGVGGTPIPTTTQYGIGVRPLELSLAGSLLAPAAARISVADAAATRRILHQTAACDKRSLPTACLDCSAHLKQQWCAVTDECPECGFGSLDLAANGDGESLAGFARACMWAVAQQDCEAAELMGVGSLPHC